MIYALFACDDDRFEFELPVNKPRMVVNFVSVDSQPWAGTLTLSMPILKLPDFEGVPGATLKVYEDGSLVETLTDALYDPRRGNETTTLSSPTPGRTYTIEASTPEYGTATATYMQPLPVPIEKFESKLAGPGPEFNNEEAIEFSVTFVDPPGENFYGIEAIAAWDSLSLHGQPYTLFFGEPAYQNNQPYDMTYGRLYFDDGYFDGQRVTMTFRARAHKSHFLNGQPAYLFKHQWVILRTVSKSYYKYLKTIDLQYKAWGDPYAQPVKVETNVKNGFGVVGGYTMTVKGKPFID